MSHKNSGGGGRRVAGVGKSLNSGPAATARACPFSARAVIGIDLTRHCAARRPGLSRENSRTDSTNLPDGQITKTCQTPFKKKIFCFLQSPQDAAGGSETHQFCSPTSGRSSILRPCLHMMM